MSTELVQWETVVRAVLAADFPRLPATLPTEVEALIPVWASRAATLPAGVQMQQIGGYLVTYSATTSSSWMTSLEVALMAQYRRPRFYSTSVAER